jgi:hypothetical protein
MKDDMASKRNKDKDGETGETPFRSRLPPEILEIIKPALQFGALSGKPSRFEAIFSRDWSFSSKDSDHYT